jgi:hypothetical protein
MPPSQMRGVTTINQIVIRSGRPRRMESHGIDCISAWY